MPGRHVTLHVRDFMVEPDLLPVNAKRTMNAVMNKSFREIMKDFFKALVATRLSGPPGIKANRRSVRRKLGGRGRIQIPAKARALGFYARLFRKKRMDGKGVVGGSGSPVLYAHQVGDPNITAKRGRFLAVKIRTAVQYRKVFSRPFSKKVKLPLILLVPRVVLPPRLGFYALWDSRLHLIFSTIEKYKGDAIAKLNQAKVYTDESEVSDGASS